MVMQVTSHGLMVDLMNGRLCLTSFLVLQTTIISREVLVLCHFCKKYLMLVIICKNDKHHVTLYNVIFSNRTGILSHLSYIFY